MKRVLKKIKKACTSYFSLLLLSLLLLFILRPHDRQPLYVIIWQFCLTGVFFASIFNCDHSHSAKATVIISAIPALFFNWLTFFYPTKIFLALYLSFTFIFITVTMSSIITRVILKAKATLETLRGVICVYFMIAFAFSFLYLLVEMLLPDSFEMLKRELVNAHYEYFSELFYFSFITLLTIGFGDIAPIRDVAQTCVIIEGIIGKFYIAILVARIVAVYSHYAKLQEKTKKHLT